MADIPLDAHAGRYSPRIAAAAFEWLRTVATAHDAPLEAGIALDLWHAATVAAPRTTLPEPKGELLLYCRMHGHTHYADCRECNAYIEARIALVDKRIAENCAAQAQALTWRPIETAPKDATNVLLRSGNYVTVGHWHPRGFWCSNGPVYAPYRENEQPTTWMPIPP